MKRAAIYGRVSTRLQRGENKRSLSEQEHACRGLCARFGYEVVEEFVKQEQISGAELDRPQLEEIFAAARAGKVDVIVVDCIDRLSREPYHMAAWMVEAERYGVTVEFVDAPDDATEEGRMLRDVLGIFARHERRRIQERTNRMRRARAKSGLLNPGALPLYGYCWSDEEIKASYVIDEQAAAVVRRLFEDVAAGVLLKRLARNLTNEGILPPVAYQQAKGISSGDRRVSRWWYPTTIRRIIMNPSYVGEHAAYRYNRFADRRRDPTTGLMKKRMKVVIRADDDAERIEQPGICPPLLSKEVALAAQARLEQNKREASRSGKAREESLLRGGFALCGYCNVLLYCEYKGAELRYICRTHKLRQHAPNVPPCPGGCFTIMQPLLDRAVWTFLTDALTTPQILERRLLEQDVEESQNRPLDRRESMQEAVRRLDRRRLNFLQTLGEQEDESTRAWLSGQIKELAHQIQGLEGEMRLLEEQRLERGKQLDAVRRLVDWGQRAQANLERMSLEEKRHLLYGLGVKVRVWNRHHDPRVTIELGGIKSFPVTALPLLEEGGRAGDAVTNSHEFAYGTFTRPTANPWDLERIPGGSSGGSAAALAARMCSLAIGTDTGGSIRIPAACCGVTGLKPTYGLVSAYGIIPLSWSLDHPGPLAHSVEDCAVLLDVLVGYDPRDPASLSVPSSSPAYAAALQALTAERAPLAGLRLGVPDDDYFTVAAPEIGVAVQVALKTLEELGAQIESVRLPGELAELFRAYRGIQMPEATAAHSEAGWWPTRAHLYSPTVRSRLEMGSQLSTTDYVQAQRLRRVFSEGMRALMQDVDALVLPSLPILPPRIDQLDQPVRIGNSEFDTSSALLRFTFPFNMTGQPALSLPCGFSTSGLPIGLQVVGRHLEEAIVLRIGHTYQEATSWHRHRPTHA